MADFSGLDPSVLSYLQSSGPPIDPQQLTTTLGPKNADSPAPAPPSPPPMPPPTGTTLGPKGQNMLGVNGGIAGDEVAAPDDPGPASVTGGQLHPMIAQAIQNGFPIQHNPDYQLAPDQLKPIQKAADEANAAVAKADAVAAKQQAAAAAYAATPEGQQQQAYQQQVAGNEQQAQIAQQQGQNESDAAKQEADIKAKAAIDLDAEVKKQQDQRAQMLAQQNQLHADMMKAIDIAQKKTIDPNRMWNNMSTGGKIATKMGIVLAGLGNGMSGNGAAANQAAQMFEDDIKQDVDAQKAGMQQANDVVGMKRNALDDYIKIAGNVDGAATLKRAEMRDQVAAQLEANAAKYKSPTALLAAQQTAAVMRKKSADDLMDLAGKRVQQQHQAAELRNQQQQTAIAGGHLALAQKQFDWTKQKDQQQLAIDYLKTTGKDSESAKKAADELAAGGVMLPQSVGPNGKPQFQPATNQDGSPFIVPKDMQKDFSDKREGFMKGMDAVDALRSMRSESGGNLFDTAEKRAKLQEFERAIVGMHEQNGITRFSPDVIDLMKKQLTGGADPTSVFKAIMPSLDQARDDMQTDFTNTMRSHGNYTGDPIKVFDPLSVPKAAETPADVDFKAALSGNSGVSANDLAKNYGTEVAPVNPTTGLPDVSLGAQQTVQAANAGIGASRQRVLDNLTQLAKSSDPKIANANRAQLEKLASDAQLPAMRQAAQAALTTIDSPLPVESPGGPRGVVQQESRR